MATWDIWAEGQHFPGDEGTATKLNREPIEAESFDAAVHAHIGSLPKNSEDPGHFYREDDGQWTLWGSRLYPDEQTAKRTT